MKKFIGLFCLLFLFASDLKAQFLSVQVNFKDNAANAANFIVPASIRNSDSASFPNALTLLGSAQGNGYRIDSFSVDPNYTNKFITINYYDCNQWKTYSGAYTGSGANIQITLSCSPRCNPNFSSSKLNLKGTFYAAETHAGLESTWYFGDGDSATGDMAIHFYSAPGLYFVTHISKATNANCSTARTDSFAVSYPCDAQFSVSASSRDISTQSLYLHSKRTHYWSFGDGQSSNNENPNHTYNQDGAYKITHFIYDSLTQCNAQYSDSVFISTSCDAYFGNGNLLPYSSSIYVKDSSVKYLNYPTNYTWSFGDSTYGSGSYQSHNYTRPDSFEVKLILENGSCKDSFSRIYPIGLGCESPSIIASPRHFDSLQYYITKDYLKSLPFTKYTFKIEDSVYSNISSIYHTFQSTGLKSISLIWDNGHGCSDSNSTTVFVTCDTSVHVTNASIVQTPANTGMTSVQMNSSGYKKQQKIIMGNGDTLYNQYAGPYWYKNTGTYNVAFIAYNNFTSDTMYRSVTITDSSQCIIRFNGAISTEDSNHVIYSTQGTYFNNEGGQNRFTYLWDLDGGELVYTSLINGSRIFFKDSGTYTVKLRIQDSLGYCTTGDSFTVHIENNSNCNADFTYEIIGDKKVKLVPAYTHPSGNVGYEWRTSFSSDHGSPLIKNFNNYGDVTMSLEISHSTCNVKRSKVIKILPPCVSSARINGISRLKVNFATDAYNQNYYQTTEWIISTGDTIVADSFDYVFPSIGTYTVQQIRKDSLGDIICSTTYAIPFNSCGIYMLYPSQGIPVTLNFDGSLKSDYDSVRFYLITVDSVAQTVNALDSFTLYNNSNASFFIDRNCYQSSYVLLKAATLPGSKYYSDYLPTYSNSSTLWTGSVKINIHGGGAPSQGPVTLDMIKGTNPGGPGFIGGFISQGANKNGAGLDGIQVNLYTINDAPVSYTYSFNAGRYEFKDLAYGKYKIIVDYPGKSSDIHYVHLNASNEKVDDLNFEVNSTYISTLNSTQVLVPNLFKAYPNPATNLLSLESITDEEITLVKVYDMAGIEQAIEYQIDSNQKLSIDLSTLKPGVYFVRAGNDKIISQLPFIKK